MAVTVPASKRRPFRLTAPAPLERHIQEQCVSALEKLLLPPAMFWAYPAGVIKLTGDQMARLMRFGLKRGLPDIWIAWRPLKAHGPGLYAIELKRPGGTLSKTRIGRTRRGSPRVLVGQDETFPKLMATGAFVDIAVCSSVEEMLERCRFWGLPLRPHVL
jgi:hypothetical protein